MVTHEIRREIVLTRTRLDDLERQLRQAENERFVRVHFPGNTRVYCYELPRGVEADIGDYVIVWSPYTNRDELCRIAYRGPGTWSGRTKIVKGVVSAAIDTRGSSYDFGPEIPF